MYGTCERCAGAGSKVFEQTIPMPVAPVPGRIQSLTNGYCLTDHAKSIPAPEGYPEDQRIESGYFFPAAMEIINNVSEPPVTPTAGVPDLTAEQVRKMRMAAWGSRPRRPGIASPPAVVNRPASR